jgi:hypothetical protein
LFSVFLGEYPDLQEMQLFVLRVVELAVQDARSGGHALYVTRWYDGTVSHAVLVLDRTVDDVRDDLHVLVRMRAEALPGRDTRNFPK